MNSIFSRLAFLIAYAAYWVFVKVLPYVDKEGSNALDRLIDEVEEKFGISGEESGQ